MTAYRWLNLIIVIGLLCAVCITDAKPLFDLKRKPGTRSVARLDEMMEWIAREQQAATGGYTWRNHVAFSAGPVQFRMPKPGPPEVVDTCMVALAMLRAMDAPHIRATRKQVMSGAIEFVEKVAGESDPKTLTLSPQRTPLSVRIGPHVDTFFALWLLAEVRDPGTPTQPDLLVQKLIEKVESNISPEGCWIDPAHPALNSPLLGHAIGVRALETALRRGFKVRPEIVARAEQYAIGDAALKYERRQSGKWKPSCGGFRPKWMSNQELDDLEPINEDFYLSAARLSVLDQADRSNALQEKQILERLKSPVATADLAKFKDSLQSIVATRRTLATARGQMLNAYRANNSFAPFIYAAEDYLATLLTVDALSAAAVEQWFPPTIRQMIFIQDVDGGLKAPDHIECLLGGPFFCHNRGVGTCPCTTPCMTEAGMTSDLCDLQKSFIARDRVFCTAAGMAILLADTPYRQGFLDVKSVK
jgi:hypothetical protein